MSCPKRASPGMVKAVAATLKLRGKRLVVRASSREPADRRRSHFSTTILSGLTESSAPRPPRGAEQEFTFEATLIMTGNEVPRINADESFWQKFKPIPFENPLANEDPEYAERVCCGATGHPGTARPRACPMRAAGYRMTDPPEVAGTVCWPSRLPRIRLRSSSASDQRDPGSEVTVKRCGLHTRGIATRPPSAVRSETVRWRTRSNGTVRPYASAGRIAPTTARYPAARLRQVGRRRPGERILKLQTGRNRSDSVTPCFEVPCRATAPGSCSRHSAVFARNDGASPTAKRRLRA